MINNYIVFTYTFFIFGLCFCLTHRSLIDGKITILSFQYTFQSFMCVYLSLKSIQGFNVPTQKKHTRIHKTPMWWKACFILFQQRHQMSHLSKDPRTHREVKLNGSRGDIQYADMIINTSSSYVTEEHSRGWSVSGQSAPSAQKGSHSLSCPLSQGLAPAHAFPD